MSFHSCTIPYRESVENFILFPLYLRFSFFLAALRCSSICCYCCLHFYYCVFWCYSLWVYFAWYALGLWNLHSSFLPENGGVVSHTCSSPFPFSSTSGVPIFWRFFLLFIFLHFLPYFCFCFSTFLSGLACVLSASLPIWIFQLLQWHFHGLSHFLRQLFCEFVEFLIQWLFNFTCQCILHFYCQCSECWFEILIDQAQKFGWVWLLVWVSCPYLLHHPLQITSFFSPLFFNFVGVNGEGLNFSITKNWSVLLLILER